MTDKQFTAIFNDACSRSDENAFVSGWQMEDHKLKEQQLRKIWEAAHLPVTDIRAATGLSQAKFADKICAPFRTVQDWEYKKTCPDYVRLMLIRQLKILDI